MSTEEARKIVSNGLERRKAEKESAARESRLEAYERDMIAACNDNCAEARVLRMHAEADRHSRQKLIAYRKEERDRLEKEWKRDVMTADALRKFVYFCMSLALITVWTPLPWWAATALIFGAIVMLAAYIFRLYFPLNEV